MEDFNSITNMIGDILVAYVPNVIGAIIALIIGLWIIKMLSNSLEKLMIRKDTDQSLRGFLKTLFSIVLKILLILSIASMVGIETTSFIAIIGAAGLAIGLALQGSLANFAGGVLILLLKPFKVGDYVEIQGNSGTVKDINVFATVLNTPDNVRVIVPNGPVANSSIKNYTAEDIRRVDMVFGIGYSDDIAKSRSVLESIIKADERVLNDPEHMIVVSELADSSVNFSVRVWTKKEDYWAVFFDMHEKVKLEFDSNDISIPFPQRDIHLFNQ